MRQTNDLTCVEGKGELFQVCLFGRGVDSFGKRLTDFVVDFVEKEM